MLSGDRKQDRQYNHWPKHYTWSISSADSAGRIASLRSLTTTWSGGRARSSRPRVAGGDGADPVDTPFERVHGAIGSGVIPTEAKKKKLFQKKIGNGHGIRTLLVVESGVERRGSDYRTHSIYSSELYSQ